MGMMRAPRDDRRVMRLLALNLALALAATSLPATAQSGSEAVVCVGGERRTLATNPIRRVYTEDMDSVLSTQRKDYQNARAEKHCSLFRWNR